MTRAERVMDFTQFRSEHALLVKKGLMNRGIRFLVRVKIKLKFIIMSQWDHSMLEVNLSGLICEISFRPALSFE